MEEGGKKRKKAKKKKGKKKGQKKRKTVLKKMITITKTRRVKKITAKERKEMESNQAREAFGTSDLHFVNRLCNL